MALTLIGMGALILIRVSNNQEAIEGLREQVVLQSAEATTQRRVTNRLAARIEQLEASMSTALTPAEVAAQTRGSVFSVESGAFGNEVLGSAFVVRSTSQSSLLITNFHVVRNTWSQGEVVVDIKQGDRTYVGTIEAVSSGEDLAAIRVPLQLEAIPTEVERPAVGDAVVVIGSPLGLERTVATGVVSAFREGYIQFSAPVSPGDSGAPLLNDNGEAVGVVVSKLTGQAVEGLSFAVPISTACSVLLGC